MPKFDYRAAKESGATDEQIAKYLEKRNAQGADLYIDRAERYDRPDTAAVPFTPLESPPPPFSGRAIGALPSAGGLAGGLSGAAVGAAIGAPFGGVGAIPGAAIGGVVGGIGGAGLGGFTGEALRQNFAGEKYDTGAQVRSGAEQAFLEALGIGTAGAARMAARPVMRSALSRLPKGFPNPVETMLQEGIPVSKGGLAKANRLRGESAAELGRTLTQAENRGTTFARSDVVSGVNRVISRRATRPAIKKGIEAELAEFLAQHPDQLTPTLLKEIKTEYQEAGSGALSKALTRGTDAGSAASQRFARALRGGAQRELEKIPGVAKIEGRTQALIGAGKAIESATSAPPRLVHNAISGAVGGAVGYGVSHNPVGAAAGIAAAEALTSRNAVSRYAMILNSKAFRTLMKQSPRIAAEFIHQATRQEREPNGR